MRCINVETISPGKSPRAAAILKAVFLSLSLPFQSSLFHHHLNRRIGYEKTFPGDAFLARVNAKCKVIRRGSHM